jgi:hypothetical protein
MTAPATASSAFRQVRGLEVLTWPGFDASGVDVMVTTRHGGVSAGSYATLNLSLNVGDVVADVLENRRRAAAALGADPGGFVFCEQVHGSAACVVTAADRGRGTRTPDDAVPGADALATADPGIVLAVLAADCVPVVLYDPVCHVVACAHAGWRGTVARAAASAVAAMQSLGTRPADVIAGVGPAIAPDRYEVGPEVAEAAMRAFGDSAGAVLRAISRDGQGAPAAPGAPQPTEAAEGTRRWLFDLRMANRLVLRQAGVPDSQIHVTDAATGPGEGPGGGLFFSHRAERPCGRFAALARLSPRAAR